MTTWRMSFRAGNQGPEIRKDLRRLEAETGRVHEYTTQQEALEGETYRKETIFRSRNRALIQAKKANSDYRCEVCGFSFEETYGALGREYIVAHHLRLIASGPSKTTLEDIALLCANCHAMVHTKNPPIPLEVPRRSSARRSKARSS